MGILANIAAGIGVPSAAEYQTLATQEIDKARQDRLAEIESAGRIQASQLADQRQIGREQRAPALAAATATATSDAAAASTIKNAPGLINVEVNRQTQLGAVKTQQALDEFEALQPAKRQEAIDTELAKVNALSTPDMLKKTRAIALAGHIVDPSYTLIPNADGTVTTFDAHSGTSKGTLKDAEGEAIIRKDPEEMRAAVAVINMANTNLRIAEAAYKADSTSLEPGVKERSVVEWGAAQNEARRISAPAYAVLYGKAKIPGVADSPTSAKTGWDNATGEVWKDGAKVGSAKSVQEANDLIHKPAAAKAAPPPGLLNSPTVKLAPGAADPNESIQATRAATARVARDAEAEVQRAKRVRAQQQDAAVASNFGILTR